MICYLVRHGKDDDTIRGGWSKTPLAEQGIRQVEALADSLVADPEMKITQIYSSDLLRAKQTAEIIAGRISVPIVYLPQFREANNGVLAGMDNAVASQQYPGLFWNTMEWDMRYPAGESPHEFFDRISRAWDDFVTSVPRTNGNVLLITHGGVINIILHVLNGRPYSNKETPFSVRHAQLIAVEI